MNPNASAEQITEYFTSLEILRIPLMDSYNEFTRRINKLLIQKNYSELSKLIAYFEEGNGQLSLKYIGDAKRLHNILTVVSFELQFNSLPFCSGCASCKELLEKYELIIFSLRRLIFRLSDSSVHDAIYFLQNSRLSPFAAYLISNGNLINSNINLYNFLLDLYHDIWSDEEKQIFIVFLQKRNLI